MNSTVNQEKKKFRLSTIRMSSPLKLGNPTPTLKDWMKKVHLPESVRKSRRASDYNKENRSSNLPISSRLQNRKSIKFSPSIQTNNVVFIEDLIKEFAPLSGEEYLRGNTSKSAPSPLLTRKQSDRALQPTEKPIQKRGSSFSKKTFISFKC